MLEDKYSYCFNASEPVYIIRDELDVPDDDMALEDYCYSEFVKFNIEDE